MMDIADLQKLEVTEAQAAPKNGEMTCCLATGSKYWSFLPTFKQAAYRVK